jgi:hypothetical protein
VRAVVEGVDMNKSRIAFLATTTIAAAGLTLCLTAGTAPAANPAACTTPEAAAFAQLDSVAAANGASIPGGVSTYTHFDKTVLAHAPLAGIQNLTANDLAKGAPIMAVFVHGDASGRVPDGAYVVRVQFQPGATDGTATYLDASGKEVVHVAAGMRDRAEINNLFPDTYEDPPTPSNIPNVTSTHVWRNDRYMVDCTGPGWNWKVLYY